MLRGLWALWVAKSKTLLHACQFFLALSLQQKRRAGSDQKETAFHANQPVDLLFPEAAEWNHLAGLPKGWIAYEH